MLILTIVVFIGLLLILVLVHEWGHFIVAKKSGCNVEEFAFGFPPRLFSYKWGDTRYVFNLLPIGGYVKIEGEDMQEAHPGEKSFATKSVPWRISILAAGVFMNIVLAVFLLTIQSVVGVPSLANDANIDKITDIKTFIVDIDKNSPAELAGMESLDRVVMIGGIMNPTIDKIRDQVSVANGKELMVEIDRAGVHRTLSLSPRLNPPPGEGALGVALRETGLVKEKWYLAPLGGVKRTWEMLSAIIYQFGLIVQRLFTGGVAGETVTGPIGIAVYTNEVTNLGLPYVLEFAALISINLAIINILPFPALDGGRIMFVLFEAIFGRKLPGKIEQVSHLAGFGLLILLMIVITWRDVTKYF